MIKNDNVFVANVLNAMREKGISAKELAEKTKHPFGYVLDILHEGADYSIKTMMDFSHILKIPLIVEFEREAEFELNEDEQIV